MSTPAEDPTVTLTLKIENHYPGAEIITHTTITVPPPPPARTDDEYDVATEDWEQDYIFPETGTDRTEGDSWYFVKVTESSDTSLVPVGTEYEFGL